MAASNSQDRESRDPRGPAPGPRSDAGAKVVVACKLPSGIVIRGYTQQKEQEAVLGGGTREFDVWRWNGKEQRINGYARPHGSAPQCTIIGDFALTYDVDKDLFDAWYEANRDTPMVRQGLIFAFERAESAMSEAKNRRKLISGFEQIDPENPGLKIRGIEKADVK
jgi:hypothetical protein